MRYTFYRLALVVVMLALYALTAAKFPDGGWDARAIHNLRAKMMNGHGFVVAYTGEDSWQHLDYPPLLPLVAAAFLRAGISVHVLHAALFAALVWLSSERYLWIGALVGAMAVTYAATQLADVPLSLCLLVATVCYFRGRYEWCGLALGLGALTKNEGALMALAFLAAWAVCERRAVLMGLRGGQVPFALLIAFKLVFPAPSDVLGAGGTFERVTDLSRYGLIALYVIPATAQFALGAFGILAGALLLIPLRARLNVPLAAVLLTWCGYMVIYIITPHDLAWHMTNSYDRLLVQLFPAAAIALVNRR